MTGEEKYFLSLLADFVQGKASSLPEEEISWGKLTAYAKRQDLCGILWQQLHTLELPEKSAKHLKGGFLSNVYLSVNSDCALEEIEEAFDQKKIAYLPFKGTLMKELYPVKELRTMGDRDILIRHEDRKAADTVMISLGYEKFIDNHAVWTYYKQYLNFEIHDVMFYEDLSNQIDYRSFFQKIWDTAKQENGYRYSPDRDLHFAYLMTHTAKHITNKGMGFRAFLDMAFFVRNGNGDWEKIISLLKELELYEFTCICFSLCEDWFDVRMPFRNEDPDREFMEEITEKIFRDGIFGLHNADNITGHSAKEIRRSEKGYALTAAQLTLHKLFPPYRDMQLIPWYKWVDGKPWLLPAAWVYRWGYCIVNKRKEGTDLLLEPYQKRKEILDREEYLKKWGL